VPRLLCALVAFAAGLVGVLMVAAPASSGTYFSWALGPPPLASLVGAFYVASAFVFGWAAARADWASMRGLCFAVLGLTVPTLVATSQHLDVFDFTRWQAVAWVVLFIASPILFGASIFLMRGTVVTAGPRVPGWTRAALIVLAAAYGAMAVLLWCWTDQVARNGPFAVAGLGAGFAGAWAAFLAITAGFAAWRDHWHEARLPLVVLVAGGGDRQRLGARRRAPVREQHAALRRRSRPRRRTRCRRAPRMSGPRRRAHRGAIGRSGTVPPR
jgi:hypothetical protein